MQLLLLAGHAQHVSKRRVSVLLFDERIMTQRPSQADWWSRTFGSSTSVTRARFRLGDGWTQIRQSTYTAVTAGSPLTAEQRIHDSNTPGYT